MPTCCSTSSRLLLLQHVWLVTCCWFMKRLIRCQSHAVHGYITLDSAVFAVHLRLRTTDRARPLMACVPRITLTCLTAPQTVITGNCLAKRKCTLHTTPTSLLTVT